MSKGFTIAQLNKLKGSGKSKYRNQKTIIEGIQFDSKKEAARYKDLVLLVKAGKISELQLQQTFPIVVNGKKVCKYIADFTYIENGKLVVEDTKGMRTPLFKLKAKLFEAIYGYKITLT